MRIRGGFNPARRERRENKGFAMELETKFCRFEAEVTV